MADDSGGILQEVARALRTRFIATAVASVVAAIIAAIGTMLALAAPVIGAIGLTPQNAVMSFARPDCPPGWDAYEPGWGRVIVGAMSETDLDTLDSKFAKDADKAPLKPRAYAEPGGFQETVLEVQHLPSHAHELLRGDPRGEPGDNHATYGTDTLLDLPARPMTGTIGGNPPTAFSNMQPYVALTICRKV